MADDEFDETAPFGTYAPNGFQRWMRALGDKLPASKRRGLAKSTLLRLAGGKQRRLFDVEIFEGAKVRLHPYDNVCEKRAFMAVQTWDAKERAKIAATIHESAAPDYYFVDAGANVGLYSLFVADEIKKAGKQAHILAIEPEPVVLGRLKRNIEFSNAPIRVAPMAITDRECDVVMALGDKNRGENKISTTCAGTDGAGVTVPGKPLHTILQEANFPRVDFLKIDLEGHERTVFTNFFAEAPRPLYPQHIVLETLHNEGPAVGALAICLANGYEVAARTRMNAILRRVDEAK